MIIKSMSRKEPSFAQLAAYLSSEKADSDYDLYLNCFSRSHEDIAAEFFENSELLSKRRNGNYLYHEIISFKVEPGIEAKLVKDGLRETVDMYVQNRCPRNMVYGCLHQDHDHNLHYHLMISANERGSSVRHRLTKKQFDTIKRDLETHVLEHHPELKQEQLITAEKQTEKMSVKAGEMKRRTGEVPKREAIKQTILDAMSQTSSMDNFIFFLSERGYQFYTRGTNFGVQIENENSKIKKYRFSTLGIHDDFEVFQSRVLNLQTQADAEQSSSQLNNDSDQSSEARMKTNQTTQSAEDRVEETEAEFRNTSKKKQSGKSYKQKNKD